MWSRLLSHEGETQEKQDVDVETSSNSKPEKVLQIAMGRMEHRIPVVANKTRFQNTEKEKQSRKGILTCYFVLRNFWTYFAYGFPWKPKILWRVMPLETPFGLVIGFITILHVVTTITYYTVTLLHSLQSVHSNIPILFGASGIQLETVDR
jgi:hypothetical protein